MNWIVRALGLLAVALVGWMAFGSFLTQAPAGVQVAPGHVAAEEMAAVAAATLLYAVAVGYIARAVLGERGFGPRFNALIALGGAWLALCVLSGRGSLNALGLAMSVVMIGSIAALAVAVIAKPRLAGKFAVIKLPRPSPAPVVAARLEKIAQPRGPSSARVRAMVSRARR